MLAPLIAITVLAFLYGFVWHNESAKTSRQSKHDKASVTHE
jgi:hypothetical protein